MSMLIRDFLEMRAEKNGDKPFLYFRDEMINFATIENKVNKSANVLRELGVKKGDHVCLFMQNCPEFIYLWFGLAKLGGIMVPLNTHLKGDGLKYIINHCDAKWIALSEPLLDSYASIENELINIKYGIWHGDERSMPENFQNLHILMDMVDDSPSPCRDIKDEDVCSIIYTSGTTGPPKGAMIRHFNYVKTGQIWLDEILDKKPGDLLWTCLPLFHANAQMWSTMGALTHGVPLVLRERFSASNWIDDIRRTGATIFNYIGGMITILMKQRERENDADNKLRWAFGGAAPKALWQAFEKRFSVKIQEGYGLTETGAIATHNPPDAIKVGSIGKPASIVNVNILDERNREIPVGQSGEIVCKERITNTMFAGYYKQPDKTSEVWEGGWFHTGDRGYKDEEGYYYFVDRIKDCIRRKGENISSYDIENIINYHPKVKESAAVPVPSELGEDDVKIYVILRQNETLDPDDLVAFCKERMACFMVPRYVEFLKEFPKTATERIQKYELIKRGIGKAWDREKKE